MNTTHEIAKALLAYYTENTTRAAILKMWFTGMGNLYIPRQYDEAVYAIVGDRDSAQVHGEMVHNFSLLVSQHFANEVGA